MSVDTEELTRRWQESWPGCPPLGHLFRRRFPDRWVRFHSLPSGRRHPLDSADLRRALNRYNSVLNALLDESSGAAIYLITVEYGPQDSAAGTEPIHTGLHQGAVPWMRASDPDEQDMGYGIHVSRVAPAPGDLDGLFRYVAEDRTTDVVVTDTALRWLFAPYDGGMDVIAVSPAARGRLAQRFSHWLSDRPDGL